MGIHGREDAAHTVYFAFGTSPLYQEGQIQPRKRSCWCCFNPILQVEPRTSRSPMQPCLQITELGGQAIAIAGCRERPDIIEGIIMSLAAAFPGRANFPIFEPEGKLLNQSPVLVYANTTP